MGAQDEHPTAGAARRRRGPLAGIRVIELADEQAEYCGLSLAGLGADVVKVEPPGGSPTRRIGPFYQDREDPERSLFFWQYNRGKRSIVLDLRQPAERRPIPRTGHDRRRASGVHAAGRARQARVWTLRHCCGSFPP